VTKRRSFSDEFKATVALEALRGNKTAQEVAAKLKTHPTQVTTWKRQAIDGLTGVFSDKIRNAKDNEAGVKELHAELRNRLHNSDKRQIRCHISLEHLAYARTTCYLGKLGLERVLYGF
jgi:transposase-like protein